MLDLEIKTPYQKGPDGMTSEDIIAYQKKLRAFADTEIGDLFLKYDSAIGNAWVSDCTSNSDRRMKRDWEKADQARRAFLAKVCEMAGIDALHPEPTK